MSDNILSMNKQFTLCIDEDCDIKLDPKKFPFKTVLSLSPLVDFWNQEMSSSAHPVKAACAKQIQEELKKVPELLEPITDLSILDKHKDLVDMLMAVVFPPASWEIDFSQNTQFMNFLVEFLGSSGRQIATKISVDFAPSSIQAFTEYRQIIFVPIWCSS